MGADIHPIIERKYKFEDGTEKWIGLHTFDYRASYLRMEEDGVPYMGQSGYRSSPAFDNRNYARFAALAGVRGEGPDPKGFPDDASDLARMEAEKYGADGHSHSWCTLKEALEICLRTESDAGVVFLCEKDVRKKNPIDYFFGIDMWDEPIDDYRVLFYFDN